jgi:GTP-binding protein
VAMDFIMIDPPTVQMQFAVNDGPFAGLDGKKVTSRAIYDRLVRETKTNISIEVGEQTEGGLFNVSARGAMQIAVLVETMRREGFEVLVSRPSVIMHEDENGKKVEPFETLFVEVLEEHVGGVMRSIAERKGQVESMEPNGSMTAIEATVPTRGLIGFEFELMNLTSGHGVMSHLFKEYAPHCGVIKARRNGSMVSMAQGTAMAYSLLPLEERGVLFASPGDEVYVGQLVGEHNRESDIPVNVIKAKALTNHRASGKDNNDGITPATKFTLERAIEYIGPDEFVEATPSNLRLRKRILDPTQRKRIEKSGGGFE